MSIKKEIRSVAVAALFLLVALAVVTAQEGSDPVATFYAERARHAFESRDPVETGTTYVLHTKSYYKTIGDAGAVTAIDSVTADYYFSWGTLDSQIAVSGDITRFQDVNLTPPNVFAEPYVYSLFPNDTGGVSLAIGFDADSSMGDVPVGLALVDREQFYPRWLYLYYPESPGYQRFTRSFRLVEYQGRIFPDSVWVVAARRGVFFSENYRVETGVTGIDVVP